MKTRAAVLMSAPGQFETVEVDLDEPRSNEVLVKVAAAGLCHSDDHLASGDIPVPVLPYAGGHEGAGTVVDVGPGTRHISVGDHVVFSFLPSCGRCRWCARGQQNLCDLGAHTLAGCRFDDTSSFRMSFEGRPVAQMAGVSTFSEYTTVDVNSCVIIRDDIPLKLACLLGCGVGTGWGAAVNSAAVQIGDTVLIIGVGGIGINAVQGAVHAGAANIIAVDPVAFKLDTARALGATHGFESIEPAAELARELTNGQGADAAIVAVGITTGEHIAAAFAAIRKAGTVVVSGSGPITEVGIPVPLADLTLSQKRIQGSLYGACSANADIPLQADLYRAGKLRLDELVTTTYTLDQIAAGFDDMRAGRNIRGVVLFGD